MNTDSRQAILMQNKCLQACWQYVVQLCLPENSPNRHGSDSENYHQATQRLILEDALPVKEESKPSDESENQRENVEKAAQSKSALAAAAIIEHINSEFFDLR